MHRFEKLLKLLEALPPEEKKLGEGRLYDSSTDCFCAVGAATKHLFPDAKTRFNLRTYGMLSDEDQVKIADELELNRDFPRKTSVYGVELDNDSILDHSPQERYGLMIGLLKRRVEGNFR